MRASRVRGHGFAPRSAPNRSVVKIVRDVQSTYILLAALFLAACGGQSASSDGGLGGRANAVSTGGAPVSGGAVNGQQGGADATGTTSSAVGGTAGGETANGQSGTSSCPDGQASCGAGSEGSLVDALAGYWSTGGAFGDCLDSQTFLRFLPDGVAESILIDANACSADRRGTFIANRSYSLAGRTLTLDGPVPSATPDGWSVRESLAVAVGVGTDAQPILLPNVLEAVDETTWRSRYVIEYRDASAVLTSRREVAIELAFGAPLPATGAGACQVIMRFTVQSYQTLDVYGLPLAEADRTTTYSDQFDTLGCQYGPSDRGQQLTMQGMAYDQLPGWVATNIQSTFKSPLWLGLDEPVYLFMNNGYRKADGLPSSP